MRKHLNTPAITVLALVAGAGVGRAQNNERIDKGTNTTPNGSEQTGSAQTQASLQDEIARMLRAHYDAWTKLDATSVNNSFTDNGFVSIDGKMMSSMLLKAHVRLDLASIPASGNYHLRLRS